MKKLFADGFGNGYGVEQQGVQLKRYMIDISPFDITFNFFRDSLV